MQWGAEPAGKSVLDKVSLFVPYAYNREKEDWRRTQAETCKKNRFANLCVFAAAPDCALIGPAGVGGVTHKFLVDDIHPPPPPPSRPVHFFRAIYDQKSEQ